MDVSIIYKYFPSVSEEQKSQFQQLHLLYLEWNSKINVISRKDIDQLYIRHVLHSLAIAKFVQFEKGTKVLDIGTGGGFPGIPLAIIFPETQFHLVDSIGKKINVVQEVADAIGLQNLTSEHQRAEKVKGQYDFVVSRAVARTKLLFQWTHQKIHSKDLNQLENGLILLKGGNLEDEMKEFGRPYLQKDISDFFTESFFETKKIIYVPK
ncbi:MAG: 16S rRNA (guanine(527)-N(7))-methyltransferase RsmG [Cyclobacteriaceae bacterium]